MAWSRMFPDRIPSATCHRSRRVHFGLRILARALGICTSEVRVHAVDLVELPVVADVIVVRM